ncbi:MAG: hypothetical protein CL607_21565 [Anaerolineaceae bacterium]|nr:hypothetical protein [Anaerolineaceae bacterium]MCA9885392.1 hypothetical protein [Anaerolineae bacterium]MCA9891449.1 hypothetical protein [Anaerolineae bacterium]
MTEQTNNMQPRIFKIGATTISEDESLAERSLDEIKDVLMHSYPEVAHATVNTRTSEDGTQIIEFLPKPGRKG